MSDHKTTILLSTAFCPSILYFAHLAQARKAFIEAFETYPKQTYRNRFDILSGNGRFTITAPVALPDGSHTLVSNVLVTNQENWRQKQWRTIESAYNKSPYFLYYKDPIEEIFLDPSRDLLFGLNLALIKALLREMELDCTLEPTSSYEPAPAGITDLRHLTSRRLTKDMDIDMPSYPQVFSDRSPFVPNLSVLDLLFNEGPHAADYLRGLALRL